MAMHRLFISIVILLSCIYSESCLAAGGLDVDKHFDLTGDGLVDASDWSRMNEDSRRAYADSSVKALGEDPGAPIEGKITRGQRYLQGLRAVYE